MIKTFGLLVLLICALASFNFAQGVDAGVKEVKKKPTPKPTKAVTTKSTVKKATQKPTKPAVAKPTVSKSTPSTKNAISKPKPSSAN